MYEDLKREKFIVDINMLMEHSQDVHDDIDLYCAFMKDQFLTLSGNN